MAKKNTETQASLDKFTRSWARMVDCISHDLTTPLVILRMNRSSLSKIFPSLYEGYRLAIQHNLLSKPEKEHSLILKMEEHITQSMEKNVDTMQKFLSILHPYNKQLLSLNDDEAPLSAKTVVESVLKEYPFPSNSECALIKTNFSCDFTLNCAPIFAKSLLNNLLNNALHAISKANKGEIIISTEETEDYNILHFKDTGCGMDDKQLKNIFRNFFSKREDKIVPGLGFCQLAFLQRNGDILCQSVPGEFTEFNILSFKNI